MKYICIKCNKKEDIKTTDQVLCSVCKRWNNDTSQVLENKSEKTYNLGGTYTTIHYCDIVFHSSLGHTQKHICHECLEKDKPKEIPETWKIRSPIKRSSKPMKEGRVIKFKKRRKK